MHLQCIICSDLVNSAENVLVTKCGHVFHSHCLSQWIARSKSCPQCRNEVTDKCIFRMYPTMCNEATQDDAATLQSKLDHAQIQLRQQKASNKVQKLKLLAIENEVSKNMCLLALTKATKMKLQIKESEISELKNQLDYVKKENNETCRLKEENKILKNKLVTSTGMERHEIDTMLQSYTDVKTVATCTTALKATLSDSENKKNELRNKLQLVKHQLTQEKNINNLKPYTMSQDIIYLE